MYSNAYHLMINQVVVALGGFVFWIIAARFLITEAVGLAGAILPAVSLIASISDLGLSSGLIRFLPNAGSKTNKMLNTSFSLFILVSLVASLIYLFGLGLWSPALLILRSHPLYFVGFIIFVLASGLIALLNSTFIAFLSSKFTSFMSLATSLLSIPLFFAFNSLFQSFSSIVAARGSATIIALLVGVIILLPRINRVYSPRPQISKGIVKEIIPYSIGNHIGYFIGAIVPWLLPLIVLNVLGAEANAYFYIAWAMALTLMVIPTALSMSAFAESSHKEESLQKNLANGLRLSILFELPVLAIIFAFGDKILLLFGKDYSEGSKMVLWLLSLNILPATIVCFYTIYGRVKANFKIIIGTNAALTVFILSLTFFLAPRFEVEGVAGAYLAGYILTALGIIVIVLRKEPRRKLSLIFRKGINNGLS